MISFFNDDKKVKVLCTRFKSKNEKLINLVEEINDSRDEHLILVGLECSSTEVVDVDGTVESPPTPSAIWSLYTDSQIENLNLQEFMKTYYDSIGENNINEIVDEIRSWLNHPQMDEHTKSRIIKSLES